VEEVIHHGSNGLLVDFFSTDEIARYVIEALCDSRSFASLRQNARQTVIDRYDLHSVCLPEHLRLLNAMVPRSRRVAVRGDKRVQNGERRPAAEQRLGSG